MNSWKEYLKKSKKKEMSLIKIALILIFLGIIADYYVKNNHVIFVIEDIEAISLTLLQIQSGISTLTLSIIALLSGFINDSYLGISISEFFLDIKPIIFSQKRIIILEFILLLGGIGSYYVKFFNSLSCIFLISIIYIIYSILQMYSIFKGKKNIELEIENYLEYSLINDDEYYEIIEMFIDYWRRIIPSQSKYEYEKYCSFIAIFIHRAITIEDNYLHINSVFEKIILLFLQQDNKSLTIRAFNFIDFYYSLIQNEFKINEKLVDNKKDSLELVSMVDSELYSALSKLTAEEIERNINFKSIMKTIITTSIIINHDESTLDIQFVISLSKSLGKYLLNQKKKNNFISYDYWQSQFFEHWDYDLNSSSSYSSVESVMIKYDFAIFYGYLYNGFPKMIIEELFTKDLNTIYDLSRNNLLKYLSIHCYLYYLAYRESNDYVKKFIKKTALKIINSKVVFDGMNSLFDFISYKDRLLEDNLLNDIKEVIKNYECLEINGSAKIMIMDSVINDYYLSILLYISRYNFDSNLYENQLKESVYFQYCFDTRIKSLREYALEIWQLFDDEPKEQLINEIDEQLTLFSIFSKEKYKNKLKEENRIRLAEYKTSQKDSLIKNMFIDKINEKIGNIFKIEKEYDLNKIYNNISLLDTVIPLQFLDNNITNKLINNIISNIGNWLIKKFSNEYNVPIVSVKEKFNDNDSIQQYIDKHKFNKLYGSQRVFCSSYSKYQDHISYLKSKEIIPFDCRGCGFMTLDNCVSIKIESIKVEISPATLQNVTVQKNSQKNEYIYSPINDLSFTFTKSELNEFISSEKVVITVKADITILTDKEDLSKECVIFKR